MPEEALLVVMIRASIAVARRENVQLLLRQDLALRDFHWSLDEDNKE